jgi:hypothetical protein
VALERVRRGDRERRRQTGGAEPRQPTRSTHTLHEPITPIRSHARNGAVRGVKDS